MIKFFRRIRKSLINQNNMGKYFKYAIGEIILVVLGILIAVQLNNWNESRLKEEELVQLLTDLEEFLDTEKELMTYEISVIKKSDSIINLAVLDSINGDQLTSLPSLKNVIFNPLEIPFKEIGEFETNFSNIDNLVDRKQDFPEQLWPLIYDLESLQKYGEQINHYSKIASEASKNYRNFLLENYPEFFVLEKNSFNQHLLEEPTSKTRLLEIKEYLEFILKGYNLYNYTSAHLNGFIKHNIHGEGVETIQSLWEDYNLPILDVTSCSDQTANNSILTKQRRLRILAYNNSDVPIQFEVVNQNGEILRSRVLNDKGVLFLFNTSSEINTINRYTKMDSCVVVIDPQPFSCLIIE